MSENLGSLGPDQIWVDARKSKNRFSENATPKNKPTRRARGGTHQEGCLGIGYGRFFSLFWLNFYFSDVPVWVDAPVEVLSECVAPFIGLCTFFFTAMIPQCILAVLPKTFRGRYQGVLRRIQDYSNFGSCVLDLARNRLLTADFGHPVRVIGLTGGGDKPVSLKKSREFSPAEFSEFLAVVGDTLFATSSKTVEKWDLPETNASVPSLAVSLPFRPGRIAANETVLFVNYSHQVHASDRAGKELVRIGTIGRGPGEIQEAQALCLADDKIFIADHANAVHCYTLDGQFVS